MHTMTLFEQAKTFLTQYFVESELQGLDTRLTQVEAEILLRGTYRLTEEELTFGAKVAWRNSNRCMGRLFWKSLKVRDRRTLTTAKEVFEDALEHIESATNGGKIRATLTAYATEEEGDRGFRIMNKQLIRFAGYSEPHGEVIGDPDSLEFTKYCLSLGWEGKKTAFDVLPLVIQSEGEPASWFAIPEEKVLRVAISHPAYSWMEELGLQWYAVPVISDMRLEIGGISFPCAPFNGWYMLTEIAARNFGDVQRYNMLPEIANKLNLDTRQLKTLWKDKAMLVLQEAVLHSFQAKGVTLVDHHTASEQFMQFFRKEEAAGRSVAGDWSWLVPPLSGSTMEVFHHYYESPKEGPAFVAQSNAWEDGGVGSPARCPFHG